MQPRRDLRSEFTFSFTLKFLLLSSAPQLRSRSFSLVGAKAQPTRLLQVEFQESLLFEKSGQEKCLWDHGRVGAWMFRVTAR